ncbi:MAG TPA: ATP-dependent Clp protease proteolytic subunit [Methylomirabilota bacterium]|nr:ATP-dependent Clp protease proteolytic subunit [Methylomirabilota bacterium]
MGAEEWLQRELLARRIVLVTGVLTPDRAAAAAAALMALDAADRAPIVLHLDSGDGALDAAFTLIDAAAALSAPLHVWCRGQVGGPVVGLLGVAERCAAAPHARFHLRQPSTRFDGTPDEIAAQSRLQQDLLWRLYALLARRTGRPAEEIAEDMRRGVHLSAEEARVYGLIEGVMGRAGQV